MFRWGPPARSALYQPVLPPGAASCPYSDQDASSDRYKRQHQAPQATPGYQVYLTVQNRGVPAGESRSVQDPRARSACAFQRSSAALYSSQASPKEKMAVTTGAGVYRPVPSGQRPLPPARQYGPYRGG